MSIHDTYQHYKRGMYRKLYDGYLERTGEPVVIYQALDGDDRRIWVRPLEEWLEKFKPILVSPTNEP
ncbi:MAG: DUF1653 domain-containing protein [Patescibacteria group bacterium]|nr:DUF1653 domain-containing protein [Patescibacteria group bacterium]